jgi:hypothetical protein
MLKLVRNLFMLALAGSLLASCASVLGPRDIELPLHKLQAGLDRRFPLNNRMLELFDVELTRPQLAIAHDDGRIGLVMDATVAPQFMRRSWRGSLALSGRLYLDNARNAVLMGEPRLDRFTVDGLDEARQRQLTRAANLLMEKVVADVPLYHFRPEDLRYGGVQFVPTRIATTPRGLLVSVEPAK